MPKQLQRVDIEVKNSLCNSDREKKSHARDINFSIENGAHRDRLNVVFTASPEAEIFVTGQTHTNCFPLQYLHALTFVGVVTFTRQKISLPKISKYKN